MEMTANSHGDHSAEKESIWYTYVGETGAATVAFLYVIALAVCLFIFVKWG